MSYPTEKIVPPDSEQQRMALEIQHHIFSAGMAQAITLNMAWPSYAIVLAQITTRELQHYDAKDAACYLRALATLVDPQKTPAQKRKATKDQFEIASRLIDAGMLLATAPKGEA